MLTTMLTTVIETGWFWQGVAAGCQFVATVFSALAMWAQRKRTPADPVADLTRRLRHPVQHAITNPFVTIRRKADRRRRA